MADQEEGRNLHVQTATWLVSRELTEAAGPWDHRLSRDDDGEYFCSRNSASVVAFSSCQSRVYYRITSKQSLSHIGRSDKKLESQLLAMKLQIEYLRAPGRQRTSSRGVLTYLQDWLPIFYPNRPDLVQEAQQLAASSGRPAFASRRHRGSLPGLKSSLASRLQSIPNCTTIRPSVPC